MFGESIDAPPCRNQETVEEFLAAPGAFQPNLSDEEDDCQDNSIADEGTTHDEVRKALPEVILPAEP